jgi:7,8-dihydropterin-6-yl-methyl-4-(beta-D-ribofuranosyl)aminobenzene 5'-phosphate synthase
MICAVRLFVRVRHMPFRNGDLKILPFIVALFVLLPFISEISEAEEASLRIRGLFNNVSSVAGFKTGWGFSCLVEGLGKTVLFDTGDDGDILLYNMRKMGIDPGTVDVIVLSHIHGDHVGGLRRFLQENPDVIVYLPATFPASFKRSIKSTGARYEEVGASGRLFGSVYTTGEMGLSVKEQSMVILTQRGLVVITGCAHPGIVDIVEKAKEICDENVYLVMGGFHLVGVSGDRIGKTANRLKELGVERVAPSHCSGPLARDLFKEVWGENFLESGAGSVIEIVDGASD